MPSFFWCTKYEGTLIEHSLDTIQQMKRRRNFRTLIVSPRKLYKYKANDKLKFGIFFKGIEIVFHFKRKLGLEGSLNMSELLTHAQLYINCEENLLAKDIEKNKTSRK